MNPHIFAALLAGGSGKRFWPASIRDLPKQMLPLTGAVPLVRASLDRLDGLVATNQRLVVTAERHVQPVRDLLADMPGAEVLGEPRARNTAAACALAARWAVERDPDAVLVTLPADHHIEPESALRAALGAAADRAASARTLVTLGLEPTRPATGFGWIRLGERQATLADHVAHTVDRFTEKPDLDAAERMLAEGSYRWNLGMFAWRADVFLEELALHAPNVSGPLLGVDLQSAPELAAAFDAVQSISVDHAVLEHSKRVDCVPCAFEWDDLGSFAALARHLPRDEHGNTAVGRLLALESTGCVAWADDQRLTALLGVEDLLVVHANGVTMVAPRDRAEEVRNLVDALGPAGLEDFS